MRKTNGQLPEGWIICAKIGKSIELFLMAGKKSGKLMDWFQMAGEFVAIKKRQTSTKISLKKRNIPTWGTLNGRRGLERGPTLGYWQKFEEENCHYPNSTTTQVNSTLGFDMKMTLHHHPPPGTQCHQYLSCYWPDFEQTLKVGFWYQ